MMESPSFRGIAGGVEMPKYGYVLLMKHSIALQNVNSPFGQP